MKIGKRTLALVLVTCLLLVCAGGASLAAADTITLTLSTPMYVEAPHRKALDALMEAYAVIAPNVKIEISGAGYSDYWSNLTSEILANNEADIMQIYPEHLSEYNTLRPQGVFLDIGERMTQAGLDGKLFGQETGVYEGKTLAISNYSWGTTGIFYRKSMLQEKGIDPASIRTNEDFREACLKFVSGESTGMGVVYGAHSFSVSEWCRLIARTASNGLYFKDGETGPYTADRVNINSPANVWAAQWWNSFIAVDKCAKLVPDKKDSRELFWNGVVPFNMDGPWFLGMTRERDPQLMEDVGILPQFDVLYDGQTYKPNPTNYPVLACISQNCKNQDAAWDFLSWMTSVEAQKIIQVCGQIPSNIAYAESEEYKADHQLEYLFVDFIQHYYAPAVADPPIPQYGEISQVMVDSAAIIFSDTPMDVKAELDNAQAAIEEIMSR